MDIKPLVRSLGFLHNNPNEENEHWQNFYEVCLKAETQVPQYFNPNNFSYLSPKELINVLCFSPPYQYNARKTHLHWTEWEITRVKCYGFID